MILYSKIFLFKYHIFLWLNSISQQKENDDTILISVLIDPVQNISRAKF